MHTEFNPASPDAMSTPQVALRTTASGTVICDLVSGIPFDQLRIAVRELFMTTNDRYRGQSIRLDVGRRDFDLFDLRRLMNMIKDEFGAQVTGVNAPAEALTRFAERELKVRVYPQQVALAPESAPPPVTAADAAADVPDERQTDATEIVSAPDEVEPEDAPGNRTLILHGTVRSGAVIRYAGDVQVFGDVNPGAQITAGGSVYIYGALKGLVCAGARGDLEQIILAFDMRPSQLRIGKVILIPGQSADRPTRYTPEVAWVSGGGIVTESYRGRHPHQRESV